MRGSLRETLDRICRTSLCGAHSSDWFRSTQVRALQSACVGTLMLQGIFNIPFTPFYSFRDVASCQTGFYPQSISDAKYLRHPLLGHLGSLPDRPRPQHWLILSLMQRFCGSFRWPLSIHRLSSVINLAMCIAMTDEKLSRQMGSEKRAYLSMFVPVLTALGSRSFLKNKSLWGADGGRCSSKEFSYE